MWLCEGGLRAGLQVIGCRLNPLNLQVACQHSTVDRKGNRRMRRKERSLGKVLLFCVLWFVVECGRYVYIRVSFRGKDALSCSTRHTGHPPPPSPLWKTWVFVHQYACVWVYACRLSHTSEIKTFLKSVLSLQGEGNNLGTNKLFSCCQRLQVCIHLCVEPHILYEHIQVCVCLRWLIGLISLLKV